MADIRGFKGLRYNLDKVDIKTVVTPPYDIISKEEQENFYQINENNVIRLEYGKIFDDDTEENNRYTRAKAFLDEWEDKGILKCDDKDSLYIYEEIFTDKYGKKHSLKGLIGLVKIEEFEKGIVLPHENTLSKAKSDRLNLMNATECNFSQIYCLYIDKTNNIKNMVNKNSNMPASVTFTTDNDDIVHNLWTVTDSTVIADITKEFKDKQLFIADGHHRYETALNYRNKRRAEDNAPGEKMYDYVLMFLVDLDNEGLVVYPTHRLVKNIENYNADTILDRIRESFDVEKLEENISAKDIEEKLACFSDKKAFAYIDKSGSYILSLKSISIMEKRMPDKCKALRELDVSVLHTLVLGDILGIDIEDLASGKNLTYTKQSEEALSLVNSGDYQCAFILNPTKVSEIKDVSLENGKMPQKSTYFYPKLITGLVMNRG